MKNPDLVFNSGDVNPFINRNLIDKATIKDPDLVAILQAQVDLISRRYNPSLRGGFSDDDVKLCVDEISYLLDALGAYKGHKLRADDEDIKEFLCDVTKVGLVLYYLKGVPRQDRHTINKLKARYNLSDVGGSSN